MNYPIPLNGCMVAVLNIMHNATALIQEHAKLIPNGKPPLPLLFLFRTIGYKLLFQGINFMLLTL